jgi:hypothetical protein
MPPSFVHCHKIAKLFKTFLETEELSDTFISFHYSAQVCPAGFSLDSLETTEHDDRYKY